MKNTVQFFSHLAILQGFCNTMWLEVELFCHHRKFYWAGLVCFHFLSLSRSYFLATFPEAALKPQIGPRMTPGGLIAFMLNPDAQDIKAGS